MSSKHYPLVAEGSQSSAGAGSEKMAAEGENQPTMLDVKVGHNSPESHPAMNVAPMNPAEEPELAGTNTRSVTNGAFGEFFGTFILVLFGDGSVAQVLLSSNTKGDYQSISWGWGLGVMFGVYAAGSSGGHINPGVTLANCVYRRFPWRKFPVYFISQLLGAMAAAAVVYGNYKSAIDAFEGGVGVRTVGLNTSSAGIFSTYPAPFMTRTGMFFSELSASAILQFLIFALIDGGVGQLMPLCLFFLVFAIGACWGWETGYAINFARDFGPRLVTYGLGYGHKVWSAGGYYFWIPMVAPFLGCLLGGFLYDVFRYTGDSPVNTPYLGLKRILQPRRDVWSNTYEKPSLSKV